MLFQQACCWACPLTTTAKVIITLYKSLNSAFIYFNDELFIFPDIFASLARSPT